MGTVSGTKKEPLFTTEDGQVITLKGIPKVILDAFVMDWKKKNPEPQPPVKELKNGDLWPDADDPWYRKLYRDWNSDMERATTAFMFQAGVKSKPPADWKPMIDVNGALNDKYLWLGEVLSDDDLEQLVGAIAGVEMSTPEGVEESKNGSTPVTEGSP